MMIFILLLLLLSLATQAGSSELFIVGRLPTEGGKEVLLFSIQEIVRPEMDVDHSSNNDVMKNNNNHNTTIIDINNHNNNNNNINSNNNNNINNIDKDDNNINNNNYNKNNNNNSSAWLLQVTWSPSRHRLITRHGSRSEKKIRVSRRRARHQLHLRIIKTSLRNYLIEVYLGCRAMGEVVVDAGAVIGNEDVGLIQQLNSKLIVLPSDWLNVEEIRSKKACIIEQKLQKEDENLAKTLQKITKNNTISPLDPSEKPVKLSVKVLSNNRTNEQFNYKNHSYNRRFYIPNDKNKNGSNGRNNGGDWVNNNDDNNNNDNKNNNNDNNSNNNDNNHQYDPLKHPFYHNNHPRDKGHNNKNNNKNNNNNNNNHKNHHHHHKHPHHHHPKNRHQLPHYRRRHHPGNRWRFFDINRYISSKIYDRVRNESDENNGGSKTGKGSDVTPYGGGLTYEEDRGKVRGDGENIIKDDGFRKKHNRENDSRTKDTNNKIDEHGEEINKDSNKIIEESRKTTTTIDETSPPTTNPEAPNNNNNNSNINHNKAGQLERLSAEQKLQQRHQHLQPDHHHRHFNHDGGYDDFYPTEQQELKLYVKNSTKEHSTTKHYGEKYPKNLHPSTSFSFPYPSHTNPSHPSHTHPSNHPSPTHSSFKPENPPHFSGDFYLDSLLELKFLVQSMREDLNLQMNEIAALSSKIDNCQPCNQEAILSSLVQTPQALHPDPCASNPCYKGTPCLPDPRSPKGYHCSHCPEGFRGDGFSCVAISCSDSPCYRGVSCVDIDYGVYRCGDCPDGRVGDGRECRKEPNNCQYKKPCFPNTVCYDTHAGPVCGACPSGMTGNGVGIDGCRSMTCDDVVCDEGVMCVWQDGPRCGPCLPGFRKRHPEDSGCVPELCRPDTCHHTVECTNTDTGPKCGRCGKGMEGDGVGRHGCRPSKCGSDTCFPGVRCMQGATGISCGDCPRGLRGDGWGRDGCRVARCFEVRCFPGVVCTDSPQGAVCGQCPDDHVGDGWQCRRISCRDRPCIRACADHSTGVTCAKCPDGYHGDGRRLGRNITGCQATNKTKTTKCTETTCFPGVKCQETETGVSCGACPVGFMGNGTLYGCRRIRCSDNPCHPRVTCSRNPPKGFRCGECPPGWEGDGIVLDGKPGCVVKTCSPTTCFRGSECVDDAILGARCGPCPKGFVGDGVRCRLVSCKDKPCYEGVACFNDPIRGFRCGSCPDFMTGNGLKGTGCVKIKKESCESISCFPGVECSMDAALGPVCGKCPDGMRGDGVTCIDVDECKELSPCDWMISCTNLSPGFKCSECPKGYRSKVSVKKKKGVAYEFTTCADIDECRDGSHNCVKHSVCTNLQGSYECGGCIDGYIGNQTMGCVEDKCGGMLCGDHATCVDVSGALRCQCKVGYAGNGVVCGVDRDHDGHPDEQLPCDGRGCMKDNCPTVPNSGQEDNDDDGVGDVCDDDVDGDGVPNDEDNCVYTHNPDQKSSSGKIGDACASCPQSRDGRLSDVDRDGVPDVCDDDQDNDGISNEKDNCKAVSNPDQKDEDGDGVGDVCDNCPHKANLQQKDSNNNFIGDDCEAEDDRDFDGIPDNVDNCPDVPNSDQVDNDEDGKGDVCDDDDDGDGVVDKEDNCPLIANKDQLDSNGNGIGNACETDKDGDGIPDRYDNCVYNNKIHETNFKELNTVLLGPKEVSQHDPVWVVRDNGAEILQNQHSGPGLAIGKDKFTDVKFDGTFYVDSDEDDDFIGFVFSYQDSSNFYAVMWKRVEETYVDANPFRAVAKPQLQLKSIHSNTGPGDLLRSALWESSDTPDQVKVLWSGPKDFGWEHKVPYRWELTHKPSIGVIRLKMYQGLNLLTDSGDIRDSQHKGGRLGLLTFSQANTIWSNLKAVCLGGEEKGWRTGLRGN